MNWLLNRLKEKSTWLGIFTLAGLLGMKLNPELQELITQAILAVAAIVAFVFRENTLERSTDAGPAALPPIELVGQSESLEKRVDPAPFVPGAAPDRNRRVHDAWVRDSVPSESQFKHPIQRNEGTVGWNDD